MKSIATVLLTLLLASATNAQQWKPLRTGAGGWMTGLDIHPDGNPVYARSDVGGAYRWNETKREWTNIVNADSIPASDVHWSKYSGVLSIASAPSDANIAYMAFYDCVYRSQDQGEHWVRTNLMSMPMHPNDDNSKLSGERLAIHPKDHRSVFFGSINNGLWRSIDGGEVWSRVKGVPEGIKDRGIRQVLFDNSAEQLGDRIVVVIDGSGIYESFDRGESWRDTKFLHPQPSFYDAEISTTGILYVCGIDKSNTSFGIQAYDGESWTRIFDQSQHAIGEIALDPFDSNHAVSMTHGFSDTYVTNTLQSPEPEWRKLTYNRDAKTIPWLATTSAGWFSLGEVKFDPAKQGRLWISEGTGTWVTSDLADENVTWQELSFGQEHLVSTDAITLPGGVVITAHWDRPLFRHDDLDRFPQNQIPSQRFNSAWDLECNPSDPDYLVAIIEDHRYCCYDEEHRRSGYSEDGGKTWTPFLSQPSTRGKDSIHGQIAISAGDRDNLVWLPSWNQMPFVTFNRGKTWSQIDLPGNSGGCCIAAPWFQREALVADRVIPHTFYLYYWAGAHVFASTDGGNTWERYANVLPKWAYHGKLRAVPEHARHLWFAHGKEDSRAGIHGLMRSTDGGRSWSELADTNEVLNVAIGKPAEGASYPTIYIQGRVAGQFGYFRSVDQGVSWKNIGTYPLGIYSVAKVMTADPFSSDRLYVGFGGNGFIYFDQTSSVAPK